MNEYYVYIEKVQFGNLLNKLKNSTSNLSSVIKEIYISLKDFIKSFGKKTDISQYFKVKEQESIKDSIRRMLDEFENNNQTGKADDLIKKLIQGVSYLQNNAIDEAYVSQIKQSSSVYFEEGKIGRALKDFVKEIFPSLSFYPFLTAWLLLDKVVKSGFDVGTLNGGEINTLITYLAIGVGLAGGKIVKNILMDIYKERKAIKQEENKTEQPVQEPIKQQKEQVQSTKKAVNMQQETKPELKLVKGGKNV